MDMCVYSVFRLGSGQILHQRNPTDRLRLRNLSETEFYGCPMPKVGATGIEEEEKIFIYKTLT
jgi:hypothetical protein